MLSLDNQKNQIINELNTNPNLSEHKYNLYQQFFIVGIEPKIMFNINKIDLKTIPEPYISPKIISKYPPNELYYINIPDNIIASHCFPQGIINSIIDNNEPNINYKTDFIFSLENQYPEDKKSSLRTKRLYFTCLLFYENIKNYYECVKEREKILKENNKDPSNDSTNDKIKEILIPKVICLSSFRPFFDQSKRILESLKEYVDNYLYNKELKDKDINYFNIYPIEKIIEGLIYNLPALPRSNYILKLNKDTFQHSYIYNKDEENNNNNDDNKDKKVNNNNTDNNNNKINKIENKEILFYESPFNRQPKNIINYSLLMKYFRIKEVFEIIKFILLEEPILFFCEDIHVLTYIIEGLISLIYPLEYQYPIISVLPEQNYSFVSIFKHFIFGINQKYTEEIFQNKGITLDNKKYIIIVKVQKRFDNILNTDEEDKLKYSVITSILSDNSKPLIKIEQDKISDIDIEDLSQNNSKENEIGQDKRKLTLPMHYFEKCSKRLEKNTADKFKEFANKNKNKKILTLEEKENIFNHEIRKTFIYFFSCILLRYQSFCIKFEKNLEILNLNDSNTNTNNNSLDTTLITNAKLNNSKEDKDFDFFLERNINLEEKYLLNKLNINDIFNSKNFIEENDTPKLDRPFYKKFFETQTFFNFIRKKIFPNSLQDKLDILFFDYKVNEKLSRGSRKIKVDIKFFNEEIKNLSGEIKINSFKKEPSKKLIEYLNNNENNCKKGINYFQKISKKNLINNNNYEDNINCDNNSDNERTDTRLSIISLHKIDEVGSNIEDISTSLNITGKISNANKSEIDENEDNKIKITFSYYVFPKLLNDDLFFKENIFLEELADEKIWLNNKNNFTIKTCNCLYNQFEREANIFIKKPIIHQNYKIYDYNLNTKWRYKYNYEECISKLWLLYLAKTFDSIAFSKKRYYFEEILMFLNDKKNKVDQDTILLLFNAINKYGDKNMNQELFLYLYKKRYINFLCLREKTKSENNFVKYMNSQNKNKFLEANRGSTGTMPEDVINKINNLDFSINKKKENENEQKQTINRKLFDFYIYSYCSPNSNENKSIDIDLKEENLINLDQEVENEEKNGNDNNENNKECGELLIFNIKDLFQYESNKKYIELICQKCHKKQNVIITCIYNDDDNNKFRLNFNLVSPLALQKEPWFKYYNKLDTSYISNNYPEEYLSAIFYFYEQGLPCNFLLPKGILENELKEEKGESYNNIDPIEDIYLNSKVFCHKKSISILHSPRFRKREVNFKEGINIYERNKSPKAYGCGGGRKSPSPKKSSIMKRSKFSQNKKNTDMKIKTIKTKNVTFSCFKK